MDTVLYLLARALIGFIQLLPLPVVARMGRGAGLIAWVLDARHRKVALANLQQAFQKEKSPAEIKSLARENFRRIGESLACAARTSTMSADQVRRHLDCVGAEKFKHVPPGGPRSFVFAVGHFGNFELYARLGLFVSGYRIATTYRGLRQPALNRLMQSLRERSGCQYFERRTDAAELKAALAGPGLMLGLLADQHAGDRGLRLPFFGVDCSISAAPAVFALRYGLPLYTSICYRTGLAHWRLEMGEQIPTIVDGQPRSVEDISRDINAAFETAIRRDPANWFWVHNRWKPGKHRMPAPKTSEDDPGDD